jgi:hypothetical protein
MRTAFLQRAHQAVRKSVYRHRESQLAILLAALRLCDSRARLAAARAALKR